MPRSPSEMGLAFLLLAVSGTGIAGAAETRPLHPVYSSVRFQIGNGLPIAITFAPVPHGRVHAAPGGVVLQGTVPATIATTLPSGRSLMIATSQLLTVPSGGLTLPVFVGASAIFQVYTRISVGWPAAAATFAAGGRASPSMGASATAEPRTSSAGQPGPASGGRRT